MLAAAFAEVLPVENPVVLVRHQAAHDVHPLGARHEHEHLRRIVNRAAVVHVHVRGTVGPAVRRRVGFTA